MKQQVKVEYRSMQIEYVAMQASCTSVEHIVKWLNELGLHGWIMCGKLVQNRRNSSAPTFYFYKLKNTFVDTASEER
jgi:hypothetical protein